MRTPEGRYQPIKFRNNSQITETIPRSLFHKANSAKKILYVKSTQLPKLNGKPVFLAINPMNPIGGGARAGSASSQRSQPQARGGQPQMSDQVSILVKAQKVSKICKFKIRSFFYKKLINVNGPSLSLILRSRRGIVFSIL